MTMNLEQERIQILKDNLAARQREVMHYQINIDNYRLAIKKIESENLDILAEFANNLKELLNSSIKEQAKEKLLAEVIAEQLKEVE
jgi:hypothetical protein